MHMRLDRSVTTETLRQRTRNNPTDHRPLRIGAAEHVTVVQRAIVWDAIHA